MLNAVEPVRMRTRRSARDVTAPAHDALVRSIDRAELLRALGCAIDLLLRESADAGDLRAKVEGQLRELMTEDWGSAGQSGRGL